MHKITALLIIASFAIGNRCLSQKQFTLSASAGSGISWFRGPGAVNNSVYYRNGLPFPYTNGYMINPYGRKAFGNLLAGLQADLALSPKWVLSLAVQFEQSGGKLHGDSVTSPPVNYKTTGTYKRIYKYISINPQIGRVIFQKRVGLTLHGGIDYNAKLEQKEDFTFIDENGQKFIQGGSGGEPEVNDIRVTFGACLKQDKWSIDFNYKHGLVNFNKSDGGNVYERLLHIRILYTLLSKKY